jgi:gliding motility-associated-like protein
MPGPNASFSAHPMVLTNMDGPVSFLDNSTGNITSWQWDFSDGSPTGTGNHVSHQFPGNGIYPVTLIVTDINGCTDTVVDTIKVKEIFTFYVPNVFTPNGDGLNDYFAPTGLSVDPDNFDEYVFDRWGNVMYHNTVWNSISAEPWNGTLNNSGSKDKVVMGVYVYRIKLKELDGPSHEYIGHITILP